MASPLSFTLSLPSRHYPPSIQNKPPLLDDVPSLYMRSQHALKLNEPKRTSFLALSHSLSPVDQRNPLTSCTLSYIKKTLYARFVPRHLIKHTQPLTPFQQDSMRAFLQFHLSNNGMYADLITTSLVELVEDVLNTIDHPIRSFLRPRSLHTLNLSITHYRTLMATLNAYFQNISLEQYTHQSFVRLIIKPYQSDFDTLLAEMIQKQHVTLRADRAEQDMWHLYTLLNYLAEHNQRMRERLIVYHTHFMTVKSRQEFRDILNRRMLSVAKISSQLMDHVQKQHYTAVMALGFRHGETVMAELVRNCLIDEAKEAVGRRAAEWTTFLRGESAELSRLMAIAPYVAFLLKWHATKSVV